MEAMQSRATEPIGHQGVHRAHIEVKEKILFSIEPLVSSCE